MPERRDVVGSGTSLHARKSRVRLPMWSFLFFFDLILLTRYGTGVISWNGKYGRFLGLLFHFYGNTVFIATFAMSDTLNHHNSFLIQ